MADINNQLDKTTEKVKALENEVQKLEKELNTRGIRITDEILGEKGFKEEERSMTIMTKKVSGLRDEINSIRAINIKSENIDAINSRLTKLGDTVKSVNSDLNNIYEMAARNIVAEFDTSSGFGKKSELNSLKRDVRSFADFDTSKLQKEIDNITNEIPELIEERVKNLVTDSIKKDNKLNKLNTNDEKYKKEYAERYEKTYAIEYANEFEKKIDKAYGSIFEKVFEEQVDGTKLFKGIKIDTLAGAIYSTYSDKGFKIGDAIKENDQLENLMRAFTITGARNYMLDNNPVGLLFGENILSPSINELKEEIDSFRESIHNDFPKGEETAPDGRLYYTQEEVAEVYKNRIDTLNKMEAELKATITSVNESGGYLSMYERLNNAISTFTVPQRISQALQFAQFDGKSTEDVIKEEYTPKLKELETKEIGRKIEDSIVNSYKEYIQRLSSSDMLKNVGIVQDVTSDENINKLKGDIENINKSYTELINKIQNTPIDIKQSGDSFGEKQIKDYERGLDKLIQDGNNLRESMVSNFNSVNSTRISFIKDISQEWQNFVNIATSDIRLHIDKNSESQDKLRILDEIMKDIKHQAGTFSIFDNTDAKVYGTIESSLEGIMEKKRNFGKSDYKFVINDVAIQRYEYLIESLKQYKKIISNPRNGLFDINDINIIDENIKDFNDTIEGLKKNNEKISNDANSLGIKIQDVPKLDFSKQSTKDVARYIESKYNVLRNIERSRFDSKKDATLKELREAEKSNNGSKVQGLERRLRVEEKLYDDSIRRLKEEENASKRVLIAAKEQHDIEQSAKANAYSNRIKEREKESQAIENIKKKLNEYNQLLAHNNTSGIDGIIQKLGVYQREIDKAIQKNDVARAKNVFSLYENQFGSIAGVQKSQDIAAKKYKEQEDAISKLDEKIKAYNNSLQNINLKGIDQLVNKLKEAEEEFDKAKGKNDAEGAKTAFTNYEDTYTQIKQHQEEIKNTEKAYENLKNKVSEAMSSIKHAIANVIGVIRIANNILHKVGSTIISVFNGAIHTVQRIIQLFGNLGDRIGLTHRQNNLLKGSFTELKSAIDLVVGAFNKLFNNQFIEQGKKLLSSIQSLNMLLGTQLTQSTIEWAENMETAFGLSAAELVANLREVTAVMYGLGMSTKDVQVGARNLESVGMVLSSISGLSFEETMSKIQSGMKGMTQAIDDLGLSVRESQMDAYLKKLKAQGGEFANIGENFSQLTEQQRVYVRYAAIMDQFMTKEAYSVERYAESLRTTTGSLGILDSQLTGLKSTIGTLALGLFSKVLQPLIYIVYYIRQLIIQLGEFLGVKMKLDANLNGGGTVDTTPVEDETDALDEMTDAANKAKGALDDLDHISTMSSSSGSDAGSAGSDFDYSSLLGGHDFADELAKYNNNFIEECRKSLWNMIKETELKIGSFIKEFSGRLIDFNQLRENLDAVWTHVKSIFYNTLNIARTTFGIISGLVYSVFNDLGFTTLLEKLTGVLTTFTFGVDTMLKRIAPYITKFYNKYIAGHVRAFGQLLSDRLDWLQEKANAFAEKWLNMDDSTLEAKMDALGEKFNNLLKILKEIGIIFKTIFGKDTESDNAFFNDNASENMKKLKETAEKLHEVLTSLWDIIKGIAHEIADVNDDGVVDSKDLGTVIDKINEKLERVKNWLSENKEEIINLAEKVAETLGKLAETKFDILMTVLEFITENADLINGVLDTIQKILDFVSEHPLLSFGIAVGVQLAGHAIKTAATALIWRTILGTGTGGGLATAVSGIWGSISTKIGALATSIGSAIKNGITGAISGMDWAAVASSIPPLAIAISVSAGAVEAFKSLNEDFIGKDGIKWKNDWDFDTLDNGTLQKQADAYYKVLRDNFGYEIPRTAIDNAVEIARQQLEDSGKYTAEQIDRMVAIVEEDIYEDIEHPIHNLAWTGDWDAITNKVTVVDREVAGLSNTFETTSGPAVKSLDDIEQASSTSLNNINSNVTTLDSSISETANNVSSSISLIELAVSRASSAVQSFSNAFKKLFSSNIAEKLRELADIKINIGNFGVGANLINGTKTTKVKGFKGYANGGLPSTGSLFMANEDGNTELVGNFGGYSGVANQGMIINAMESAVYNAVTQALKANSGNGGQTTIEVCKGGVFVGDEAGIRKLANQINNVNATGRTNIANVGFSMT